MPNSVTFIGDNAFCGCTFLTSVTIPKNVTTIGSSVFAGCSRLTSVRNLATKAQSVGSSCFNAIGNCPVLHVCEGNKNLFGTAWDVFTIQDDIPTLPKKIIFNKSEYFVTIGEYGEENVGFTTDSENYSNIYPSDFVLSSDNEDIFTIDASTGRIYGKKAGTSTVTCTSSLLGLLNSVSVTVLPISVSSITLDSDSISLNAGETITVNATVKPTNAGNKTLLWSTSDEEIAIVDANGKITAIAVGTATITATTTDNSNLCASVNVTVSASENYFTIDDFSIGRGSSITVPINLTNNVYVTAVQCDIILPEGISVEMNSKGRPNVTHAGREDDQTITTNITNGAVRVVTLSLTSSLYSGNSGAMFNLPLNVSDSIETGDYEIIITNAKLSDQLGNLCECPTTKAIATVKNYTLGDVNNDGNVAVNDAVLIINYVADMPYTTFVKEAADMNGSGDVQINDAVLLTNVVANIDVSSASNKSLLMNTSSLAATNNILMANASVAQGQQTSLSFDLNNSTDYTALQIDVVLPTGVTPESVNVSSARAGGHLCVKNVLNDGVLRVILFSLSSENIADNSGELLSINVDADASITSGTYNVSLQNIKASDRMGNLYELPESTGLLTVGNTTDVNAIAADAMKVHAKGHKLYVISPKDITVALVSVGGQSTILSVKAGENIFDIPTDGIYMVAGHKVIIK